jgi:hypothetical protein
VFDIESALGHGGDVVHSHSTQTTWITACAPMSRALGYVCLFGAVAMETPV